MTAAGAAIAERLRVALDELRELERDHPSDVETIVRGLVGHLASWRPTCVTPLSTLAPPTESITDPRSSGDR
jgi:hypothetical protein